MRKFRHIYLEVWGENVYFIKCTAAVYKKTLKAALDCEPHSPICKLAVGRFGIYTDPADGIPVYVIWIREWSSLAHEIAHCACSILKNKGIYLDESSEEAYAYLIGYLDNQLRKG